MKGKPNDILPAELNSYKRFRCFMHRKEYMLIVTKKKSNQIKIHTIFVQQQFWNVLDINVQVTREKNLHVNVCSKTVKWTQIKINLSKFHVYLIVNIVKIVHRFIGNRYKSIKSFANWLFEIEIGNWQWPNLVQMFNQCNSNQYIRFAHAHSHSVPV